MFRNSNFHGDFDRIKCQRSYYDSAALCMLLFGMVMRISRECDRPLAGGFGATSLVTHGRFIVCLRVECIDVTPRMDSIILAVVRFEQPLNGAPGICCRPAPRKGLSD
jgi:hypothetical protein